MAFQPIAKSRYAVGMRTPLRLFAVAVLAMLLLATATHFTLAAQAPYRVLLTNDDGVQAPGIQAMADALKAAGNDVTIVAPADNQSAKGTSLIINDAILEDHVKLKNGM